MRLQFQQWPCTVRFSRYRSGNLRIDLTSTIDGLPIATATVNMPDLALSDDQVLIKDYSENAGILDALIEANALIDTGERIPTGYVELALCRLTEAAKAATARVA